MTEDDQKSAGTRDEVAAKAAMPSGPAKVGPSSPVPSRPSAAKAAPKGAPGVPKAPSWWVTLRAEPSRLIAYLLATAGIGLVAAVWQACGGEDGSTRALGFPKLDAIFGSYGRLESLGLYESIWVSVRRVLIGFGYASLIGISVGIVASSFRAVGAFISPVVTFLRSLPMGALMPLFMLLWGLEEKAKWMFILVASVAFIISDTMQAIAAVPQRYVETAETLGASKLQIIGKVLVPLALPDIITSLRFMFGLALGYIMLAEAYNAKAGLGHIINVNNSRSGTIEPVYLLLFIIGLLAYLMDWTVRFFQRGIFPYRKDL